MGSQIGSFLGGSSSGGSGSGGGLFAGAMSSTVPTIAGLGFSTWSMSTSATAANTDQGILISWTGAVFDKASILSMPAPTPPYTVTATLVYSYATANSGNMGIGWTAGASGSGGTTTGQMICYVPTGAGGFQQRIANITNPTSVAFIVNQSAQLIRASGGSNSASVGLPHFLRLIDDGTNVTYQISFDAIVYTTVYTVAKASGFLGSSGYTRLCFGNLDAQSAGYLALLNWRVTSP